MQSRGYVYIEGNDVKLYRTGKPNKCEANSFDYAKKNNNGYESFESFAKLEQNKTLFRWSNEQQRLDYYNKWLEKYGATIAYGYCFYYEPISNTYQTVWHYINCKGGEYIETTPIKYPIGYLIKNIPIEEVLKARDWGDLRTGKFGTD
jgi:hypothetical protein